MGQDNQPKERQKTRDLHRKAAKRQPFERLLIVCEGEKTEPLYLGEIRRAFRLSTAHVQVWPSADGTEPLQVVDCAERLFLEGNRAKSIDGRGFDRVIAVFDRDAHATYHQALAKLRALNLAHENDDGEPVPFQAVASVPCFEIWLLLHFEDVLAPVHRNEVYARLRTHLPGYDKGQGGHFAATRHRLNAATARATARAAQTMTAEGREPYTDMHTLVSLLIAALANHIEQADLGEPLEGFSARKLRNYYLLNPDEEGERHFKLLLAETDRDTLLSILQTTPPPAEASTRIVENFQIFQDLIKEHAAELVAVCKGIAKLTIVDVSLDRSQDNPQLIFESMNSTGRELSQADLIRNFILMGLEPNLQTELYKNYWRPMEKGFGQAAYAVHFDAFMRHYLTTKTGEIPNVREVYTAFKAYARARTGDTRDLVADIYAFATYYCAMALGDETDAELKQAFHDLRELKVDVAYPFLLDAYHDYRQQRLGADELHGIVRLVESYVFRRAICAIPTNSMNKTFAGLSRTLKKDRYFESVQAALMQLPSYRRFPADDEFEREIKNRDLYNFRSRSFWLRRLENHGRKERVSTEEYSIEHILPQNEALSAAWQAELGPGWQEVQAKVLHTLGNLTLTGYNSEYSDHPFAFKRDTVTDKTGNPIGLAHSPLKLNRGMAQVPVWNEAAIQARADRLATEAAKVWRAPALPADVLAAYRPGKQGTQYAIGDHPNLTGGAMAALFQDLRQRIIGIDPCVTEEFLKLYVAYKAETNFVDVVPQAKRLRLSLNLGFHEIDDPKGLCVDVSNVGRWGNGDVEVGLSSAEQLPYVMGLIRQAFDHQMGSQADN